MSAKQFTPNKEVMGTIKDPWSQEAGALAYLKTGLDTHCARLFDHECLRVIGLQANAGRR